MAKRMKVVAYYNKQTKKMEAIVDAHLCPDYKVSWKVDGGQFSFTDNGTPVCYPLVCTGDTVEHAKRYISNHAKDLYTRFPDWIEYKKLMEAR